MKNKKIIIICLAGAMLAGVGFIITHTTTTTNSIDKSKYIGVVGATKISRVDYQKHIDQTKAYYTFTKQDLSKLSSLNKNVLEGIINDTLVQNYAEEHKITVTEAEIQSRYIQAVAGFNRNNKITKGGDAALLSRIKEMYGTDKDAYLAQVAMEILKEKVQSQVKMPLVQWLDIQKKSTSIERF